MTDRPNTPPTERPCVPENAALARCYLAFEQERDALIESGETKNSASYHARDAFHRAVPLLSSPENIRDFISCIAHGILVGMINEQTGARLLYAAQVARAALPTEARQKKTTHPLPKSTVSSPQTGEETA